MANRRATQFDPDYAVPPGTTLLEVLNDRGTSLAELAQRMNLPSKTINEIIKGNAAISPQTAMQLESCLGIPARIWNSLERKYQESLARTK